MITMSVVHTYVCALSLGTICMIILLVFTYLLLLLFIILLLLTLSFTENYREILSKGVKIV